MLTSRFIVTVLVTAQIVALSVGELSVVIKSGIITPLVYLLIGSDLISLRLGIFDIGTVLSGIFSCLITVLLGLSVLALIPKFAWKWIDRIIPDSSGVSRTRKNKETEPKG